MAQVHFTEEKATMLATLYGRALDARRDRPVLGDTAADDAVLNPVVRRAKATLHWGIDDPRQLEHYGVRLVSSLDATEWASEKTLARLPAASRLALRLTGLIPAVRRTGRIARWEF